MLSVLAGYLQALLLFVAPVSSGPTRGLVCPAFLLNQLVGALTWPRMHLSPAHISDMQMPYCWIGTCCDNVHVPLSLTLHGIC